MRVNIYMDDVADLYQIVSGWESEIKDDRRMLLSEKHKKAQSCRSQLQEYHTTYRRDVFVKEGCIEMSWCCIRAVHVSEKSFAEPAKVESCDRLQNVAATASYTT